MEGDCLMPKILIVDDDPGFVKITRRQLEELSHHDVHEANDGEQALQLVRGIRPDVVFLDVYLPPKPGYLIAKELRSVLPAARLVIVSASRSVDNLEHYSRAGCHSYLFKPIQQSDLMRALGDVSG